MGNPKHRELEVKLAADQADVGKFNAWCFSMVPSRYLHVIGPDDYYVQGANVVRHRHSESPGELTVKRRKSKSSTRDRLEIDLRFDQSMTSDDIAAWLQATGWKRQFTIIKDCHIFWFDGSRKAPGVEAVIYDVRLLDGKSKEGPSRRFVEFEIHKADSDHPLSVPTLRDWERQARRQFALGEVMTESLYEIYSGKRYGLVKP